MAFRVELTEQQRTYPRGASPEEPFTEEWVPLYCAQVPDAKAIAGILRSIADRLDPPAQPKSY